MSEQFSNQPSKPPVGQPKQLIIKSCAAKSTFDWLSAGFKLFSQQKMGWVVTVISIYLAVLLLSMLPFVGLVVSSILLAGLFPMIRHFEQTKTFNWSQLLIGFKHYLAPLLQLSVIHILFAIVINLFTNELLGYSISENSEQLDIMRHTGVSSLLSIPIMLGMAFAPALIIFNQCTALQAFKLSFKACFLNALPLILFAILNLFLIFIAAIPMGLGLLIYLPVINLSLYYIYCDLFNERVAFKLPEHPSEPDNAAHKESSSESNKESSKESNKDKDSDSTFNF